MKVDKDAFEYAISKIDDGLPVPVLKPAPGYSQLPIIKILHCDNFLPSIKLVPRHFASAFFQFHRLG